MGWRDIDGYWTEGDAEFYERLVKHFPVGARVVEIGCWKGRSSRCLADLGIKYQKDLRITFVDTWEGSEEHQHLEDVKNGTLFAQFVRNMDGIDFDFYRMPSVDAAEEFDDGSLDFVFIDAAHDYDNVCADIRAWLPRVKRHGILAGHDFQHEPVRRAVFDCLHPRPTFTHGLCWGVHV